MPRELDLGDRVGIENGEADFVVEVAGQNDVLVDDGDCTIEDDGAGRVRLLGSECWRCGKEQCEDKEFCRCAPPKSNRRSFDLWAAPRVAHFAQDDIRFLIAQDDMRFLIAQDDSHAAGEADSDWSARSHQKACPRLKKKLMCGD